MRPSRSIARNRRRSTSSTSMTSVGSRCGSRVTLRSGRKEDPRLRRRACRLGIVRAEEIPARRFVTGFFEEFAPRAIERIFTLVERAGRQLEVDRVGAVAILPHEHDAFVGRDRESHDESVRFAHVVVRERSYRREVRARRRAAACAASPRRALEARRRQAGFSMFADIDDEAFAPSLAKRRPMEDLVLVAGGGAMGAGIAFVAAQGGYRVEVVEPDAQAPRAGARANRARRRTRGRRIDRRSRSLSRCHPGAQRGRDRDRSRARTIRTQARAFSQRSPRPSVRTRCWRPIRRRFRSPRSPMRSTGPNGVVGLHFFNPPRGDEARRSRARPNERRTNRSSGPIAFVERIGKTAVLRRRLARLHRQPRRAPISICRRFARSNGGVASIEELDALARAAGFADGAVRADGFHRSRRQPRDQRIDIRAHRSARFDAARAPAGDGGAGPARTQERGGILRLPRRQAAAVGRRASPEDDGTQNDEECVAIVGFGGLADELAELRRAALHATCARSKTTNCSTRFRSTRRSSSTSATDRAIAASDRRTRRPARLEETVFFVDAYATDLAACAQRMSHPERLVGYGMLGSFDGTKRRRNRRFR